MFTTLPIISETPGADGLAIEDIGIIPVSPEVKKICIIVKKKCKMCTFLAWQEAKLILLMALVSLESRFGNSKSYKLEI